MKLALLVMSVLVVAPGCHRDKGDVPSSPPSPATAPSAPSVPAHAAPAARPFTSYPSERGACASDGDCELVGALRTDPGLTGCCRQCNAFEAGTHAWAAAAIQACVAAGPCNEPLNCPTTTVNPFLPVCEQGRCVVRRNPAVWGADR